MSLVTKGNLPAPTASIRGWLQRTFQDSIGDISASTAPSFLYETMENDTCWSWSLSIVVRLVSVTNGRLHLPSIVITVGGSEAGFYYPIRPDTIRTVFSNFRYLIEMMRSRCRSVTSPYFLSCKMNTSITLTMTINKYVGSLFIQIFDVMSTSALNWKLITNEIINELNYFWIRFLLKLGYSEAECYA